MRYVIALVLVLFAAPIASATGPEDEKPEERAEPVIVEPVREGPELILTPVVVEERAPAEDAAVQDMPRRGSFWWVVGAIVVAGVILAVLL